VMLTDKHQTVPVLQDTSKLTEFAQNVLTIVKLVKIQPKTVLNVQVTELPLTKESVFAQIIIMKLLQDSNNVWNVIGDVPLVIQLILIV
jgi:hypothetical protein